VPRHESTWTGLLTKLCIVDHEETYELGDDMYIDAVSEEAIFGLLRDTLRPFETFTLVRYDGNEGREPKDFGG